MAVLSIGMNHHTAPVELRERLFLNHDALTALLERLCAQSAISEAVALSTCNRMEVYAVTQSDEDTHAESLIRRELCRAGDFSPEEIDPHLVVLQDERAVRHLFRVASGLESVILGEAQILGQVGDALALANATHSSRTLLGRVFSGALHTGKRARTETAISRYTTSVSHAAAQLVKNCVPTNQPKVLILGAGEMAQLAAQATRDLGGFEVTVINRTLPHAQTLAQNIGANVVEWSRLWDCLAQADAVICATGAPHPVLYAPDMRRMLEARHATHPAPLLVVDIAVPRDVSPDAISLVSYYDIDDLQHVVDGNLAQRKANTRAVETIIEEEVARFMAWINAREIVPVIRDLRRDVQAIIQTELDLALSRLSHLSDFERAIIERMAHRIANKLLHAPTLSLREHAANGDGENYAELVRDLFSLLPVDGFSDDLQAGHDDRYD
ncbi:MAG: glutamyl-tRNA reductase [Aggregatilineales bacterium]